MVHIDYRLKSWEETTHGCNSWFTNDGIGSPVVDCWFSSLTGLHLIFALYGLRSPPVMVSQENGCSQWNLTCLMMIGASNPRKLMAICVIRGGCMTTICKKIKGQL